MIELKCISSHPEDLADGRVFAPGERFRLSEKDAEDPHNERLIVEGKLIGTGDKSEQRVDQVIASHERREQRAEAQEQTEKTTAPEGGGETE